MCFSLTFIWKNIKLSCTFWRVFLFCLGFELSGCGFGVSGHLFWFPRLADCVYGGSGVCLLGARIIATMCIDEIAVF